MSHTYKLTYFNTTGRAEPIRFLFAYGGIKFEDERIPRDQWPTRKEKIPFGQVPVLEIDGKIFNQSVAITRYVAKLVKLAGKDELQAMEIDSVVDTINDLGAKIGAVSYEPDEEIKKKKMVPLVTEIIPFYLNKLDDIAKANNGYLACGELTWADFYFAALLDYMTTVMKTDLTDKTTNLKAVRDNVLNIPAIKKWIENRPKIDA